MGEVEEGIVGDEWSKEKKQQVCRIWMGRDRRGERQEVERERELIYAKGVHKNPSCSRIRRLCWIFTVYYLW